MAAAMPTTMDEFGHGPLSVLARSLVSVFAISGEWLYYGRQLPSSLPPSLVISLYINDCGVAQCHASLDISNDAKQFLHCGGSENFQDMWMFPSAGSKAYHRDC